MLLSDVSLLKHDAQFTEICTPLSLRSLATTNGTRGPLSLNADGEGFNMKQFFSFS